MRVRAIKEGLYGQYREEGDEFDISSDDHFSERWMERVEAKGRKADTPKEPPRTEPTDEQIAQEVAAATERPVKEPDAEDTAVRRRTRRGN